MTTKYHAASNAHDKEISWSEADDTEISRETMTRAEMSCFAHSERICLFNAGLVICLTNVPPRARADHC